ncbi:tetratricopeptide repeat protein [Ancylobacter pratisalsi]|uniref:Tetratricopeptide repeat protein n=1 Tax=Ancylobacter pratisalsi TaxID=1745854 RepID=A0A6P1YGX5_9HYPH|nr:tetratricopeptide repeat protein [Ancylobacter pratisalsi]QIB32537.1 tetratricopeptide repeat protein [Ancylobacter pratisalsi]
MADIFHEIDEDLRRERFSRLWNRFGIYIIAAAVLIVVGVAGWRTYEWWKLEQEQAVGARFEAALKLATEGKHGEAEAAFTEIEKDGTAGYRTLARFRAATELAASDRTSAVADFDAIAADSSVPFLMRDMARVRAAVLLVDTAPLAEIESRLGTLDTPEDAFRHSARELIGLAQYKAGDYKAAAATFAKILNDGQTPPGLRQRADLILALATASDATPAVAAPPVPAAEAETPATAAPAVQ